MPTPHRLFASAQHWCQLPDMLVDPFFAQLAEGNRKALDVLHELPVERTPRLLSDLDSREIPRGWRGHKNRILRGSVAWWLEQNEPAAELVCATIDAMLAEGWGPHHTNHQLRFGDLRTGDIAYCCAFACDVVPALLGEDRVAAVMKRVVEDLVPRYRDGIEQGDWWARAPFNWGPAMHANMGLIALLIEEEHPALAAETMARVREGLRLAIDFFPEGGGWTEGPMYLQTTVGHLSDFVAALVRMHDDDLGLTGHRPFTDTFDYRIAAVAPDGGCMNFSSCNERTAEFGSPQAYFWAQRCGRPDWTAFEDRHTRTWDDAHGAFYDVEAFWFRPADPELAEPQPQRHFHSKGLDWVIHRGERIWFALRAGFNGDNHNHKDLGNIILGRDQTRWLCDAGYGAGLPNQHNCATFAGGQTHCATAPIVRQRVEDGFYYACIDLGETQPFHLMSCFRHLVVLDDEHVLLLDEAHGRHGRRCGAGFHLQTRAALELPDEGPIVLRQGEERCWLQRLTAVGVGSTERRDWEHGGLPLSTLSWRELVDRSDIVHAQLLSFGEVPPVASMHEEGDRVILRIGQRELRIHLRHCDCELPS